MVGFELPEVNLSEFDSLEITSKDTQKRYNLPTEVRFCKKCTMSNQRPRITFDSEGVCNACRYAEKKKTSINWEKRESELRSLCDKHRSTDGSWDVIVPCSGGKDSARVSYELKHNYGMHPLTVTWAPYYTKIKWENFQRFIHSGYDNIKGQPNGVVHRKMSRITFEVLGDVFQPFIYGQKAFPIRIATKFDIPLVMYGENPESEYGGASEYEDKSHHDLGEYITKGCNSGVDISFWKRFGFSDSDLYYYTMPNIKEITSTGIKCHWFGYYKNWIPNENFMIASTNTGFNENNHRSEGTYTNYASLDDRLDGFHYYLSYIKFGIGRATSDTAHEIRDGIMTRDEGVEFVKLYDSEFPYNYLSEFLEYTGLDESRLEKIVDSWRSPHIWKMVNDKWELRNPIWREK
jgi:N-acetyl sugar amidotransferase